MGWLHTTAMIIHVLLAAGIVGLVLLQRGRGADAGAGFGAGASGTIFGARGSSSFLSRTTAILAALFFVTSLTLAYLGTRNSAPSSVMDEPASSSAPAKNVPAAPTTPQSGSAAPAPAPNQPKPAP